MAKNAKIPVNEIIQKKMPKWNRIETLLDQDEDRIKSEFARRLPNEQDAAFALRKESFVETFVNVAQDLVTAPVNSIFRQGIKAEFAPGSLLEEFSKNVTQGGDKVPYTQYLKDFVGVSLRSYGNVFTVIDKPATITTSRKDERENGLPYLSNIRPQDILNSQMQDGALLWIAYRKTYYDAWENPFAQDVPEPRELQYLLTRNELIVKDEDGSQDIDLSFVHGWGFVPMVHQAAFKTRPTDFLGNATMDQTTNYIITMNNMLNVAIYELQKHGSSLLLMAEDSIGAPNFGEDSQGNGLIKKQDNGGMLIYEGEHVPAYLVKDLEVSTMFDAANYYRQQAYENERDLKSLRQGSKGETGDSVQLSGVAKMVDREPLEANLVGLADDFESYTDKVFCMVARVVKEEKAYKNVNFEIDKDFDLRSLQQKFEEITIAQNNKIIKMSPTLHKEMWKNCVGDVTRDELVQKLCNKEIDAANDEDIIEETLQNLADAEFSDQFKGEPNEG